MSTQADEALRFLPAEAEDMGFLAETVGRLHLDTEDLDPAQFITLRENGAIVAFGRVKPYEHTFELGSVVVADEARGRGLGAAMVRELIARFPQDEVYVTTDIPAYFECLGFLRTTILPPELDAKLARFENHRGSTVVGMVYDRRVEQLPTIADTYRAKHLIERHLQRTPLLRNQRLSRLLDCDLYLKLENLQPVGAFKVRGGVYLCSTLESEERDRGIIGASTGNHGQSLAYGARLFGMRCVIAMPEEANLLKVESMRALGAHIEFHGANFEQAREWAEAYAEEMGMRYIHHANAMELIAGVSTISLEIIEDLPDVEVIITPVGGGSGAVGHCIVTSSLRPSTEVIAAQADGAPAVYRSWRDRCLQQAPIDTAAEGLATGHAYYPALKTMIDGLADMALVSEREMQDAISMLLESAHVVAEEAGAAATAAAFKLRDRLRGKKVAVVVSGGNMTLGSLRRLLLDHGQR